MIRLLKNKKLSSVAAAAIILGGIIFTLSLTQADDTIPAELKGLLIYSAQSGNEGRIETKRLSDHAPQATSDFGNEASVNYSKQIYLSPDRKLLGVTLTPIHGHSDSLTYISDIRGNIITSAHPGYFVSWSPDSAKVLLYVSLENSPWSRKIYALDKEDNYSDLELPDGAISADISPINGNIVYSLTCCGSDASTIYIRDTEGKDKVLFPKEENVLAWVRFSPTGDKIAFLKSDLLINKEQALFVANPDGTGIEKVGKISWGYPPVWSTDGTTLVISDGKNINEYDVTKKSLKNVTNLEQGSAIHPNYSSDGTIILFRLDEPGLSSVSAVVNGEIIELAPNSVIQDYPILP